MKAGAALGLLAGLGAINALRGGRDGTGPRFTGLLDMIDGGGAGQSGDKFEGGGLLSMLGNLFAKPIEAQRNVERIAQNTAQDKAQAEVIKKVIEGQFSPKLDGKDGLLSAPTLSPRLDGKDGDISSGLTEAQKEAIVMGQKIPPAAFDYRDFQRGTEPSTLTPEQSLSAQGILAQQAAAQAALPTSSAEAPSMAFSKDTLRTDTAPAMKSDPMGLLSTPRTETSPLGAAPSASPMLDSPTAPNEAAVMLQKLIGTVPQGVGELTKQDYADYVIAGGRLPYTDYEKTTPEYRATQQLSKQYDTFYMMPVEEQMRLIEERADILRREAPKPMPFTGLAF